jgi:ribosomal protein S27AE
MKEGEKIVKNRKRTSSTLIEKRNTWGWSQSCPNCGQKMVAVAGRKDAVCLRCGYKESCCY